MKKTILLFAALIGLQKNNAQIVYSNSFDNLSLQTYTTTSTSTKFATVPSGFDLINDGRKNNIGSITNPNKPFNNPGLKTTGWAICFNSAENDTFLVSTSWLDTALTRVDRWVITPLISNISANTVLTWRAKCPDAIYADGYEVYATAATGTLTAQSFPIGSRLFALADANTAGGGEKNTWTTRAVNLGALAGQSLRFAFRNNSTDMYQVWIDDVKVITLNTSTDAGLSTIVPKKYLLKNSADTIKLNVTNSGASAINVINVSYQVGNGSVNTENINFTNDLVYGQNLGSRFVLPFTFSSTGLFPVKCWINSINGVSDQNSLNDTCIYFVTVQNSTPQKTVLFEQFVSANNGECTDAQEKSLALQSSSVIVVNVHTLDSLKENNAAALITDYQKSIPTALIDRTYFDDLSTTAVNRQSYNRIVSRIKSVTPVSVAIINKNYNASNRQLSFTLKVDFVGEVRGDYRLNAYLTENYVSGAVNDTTINGFNQLNNFFNVPWSSYYQKGYFSAAANTYVLNYWQFQHQNALVYAFNGAYGNSGTIPSNGGTQGQSYQQTFSVTIPVATNGINKFNPDNLYIVGFVTEHNDNKNNRNVLNAVKEKVTGNSEVVAINEVTSDLQLLVYPNPSSGILNLHFSTTEKKYDIEVYDMLGKRWGTYEAGNRSELEQFDLTGLPNGVYILKISSEKESHSVKIILQQN